MTHRDRARGGWRVAAGTLLLLGCTDVPTDPTEPFSIAFEELPFTAVAVGDTLRGFDGAVAPLQAVVYNGQGDVIADASVTYVALDEGVEVEDGIVVAGSEPVASVRIAAEVDGLRSQALTLRVVQPPDSAEVTPQEVPPALFGFIFSAADTSAGITTRVLREPEGGGTPEGVPSWLVRYRLEIPDVPEPPAGASDRVREIWPDTLVWMTASGGSRRSPLDTTDASGIAMRRVQLNANFSSQLAQLDSVVVYVTTLGVTGLPGALDTIVVPIRSRSSQ